MSTEGQRGLSTATQITLIVIAALVGVGCLGLGLIIVCIMVITSLGTAASSTFSQVGSTIGPSSGTPAGGFNQPVASSPRAAVDTFLSCLRKEQFDSAYRDATTPVYRNGTTLDQLRLFVFTHPELRKPPAQVKDLRQESDRAVFEAEFEPMPAKDEKADGPLVYTLELARLPVDGWRVDRFAAGAFEDRHHDDKK